MRKKFHKVCTTTVTELLINRVCQLTLSNHNKILNRWMAKPPTCKAGAHQSSRVSSACNPKPKIVSRLLLCMHFIIYFPNIVYIDFYGKYRCVMILKWCDWGFLFSVHLMKFVRSNNGRYVSVAPFYHPHLNYDGWSSLAFFLLQVGVPKSPILKNVGNFKLISEWNNERWIYKRKKE